MQRSRTTRAFVPVSANSPTQIRRLERIKAVSGRHARDPSTLYSLVRSSSDRRSYSLFLRCFCRSCQKLHYSCLTNTSVNAARSNLARPSFSFLRFLLFFSFFFSFSMLSRSTETTGRFRRDSRNLPGTPFSSFSSFSNF